MKKLLLLLAATFGLYSCNKESQEPRPVTPERDGQSISLSFTGEVEGDAPRALSGTVDGSSSGKVVSFFGEGDVYGWVYVVDKYGEYAKEYKELEVSEGGRKLTYKGTVATTRTERPIDNATAKVSVYIGLDATGRFTNKGFKTIQDARTATSLGDNYVILKSENNELTYDSSASGYQYKSTTPKLSFTMAGSIVLIRFKNEFKASSRRVNRVANPPAQGGSTPHPIGSPVPRNAAIVNKMGVTNLHIDQFKIEVSDGKTQLKATGQPSSGFIDNPLDGLNGYDNSYLYPLTQTASIPAETLRSVDDSFDGGESIIAFYTPTTKRVNEDPGERAAFSFYLQNMADYAEERFEDGNLNESSLRSVTLRSELLEGRVHKALLLITYKLVKGGGNAGGPQHP